MLENDGRHITSKPPYTTIISTSRIAKHIVVLDTISMSYFMTIMTVCMTLSPSVANGSPVRLAHPITHVVFIYDVGSLKAHFLTETSLLVLDGNVTTSCALVLAAEEVADLLVLGLLDSGLVALVAAAHELLLDEVDAYVLLVWIATRGKVKDEG
jgi:energy-converting hydrogenase Eha subunit C